MKTSFPKPATPSWFVVDASDKVLGRLSADIAMVLRGRNKASFVPMWRCGDHVIVINCEKIKLTGSKMEQKSYFRHTGFFGSLRETSVKHMLKDDPTKVLRLAVKGMLPKNATREHTLKQLHIYAGTEHKHIAQNPSPFPY